MKTTSEGLAELADAQRFDVGDLSGPSAARRLIRQYSDLARNDEPKKIILDFEKTVKAYPNGAVPFACALDFLRESGVHLSAENTEHERSLPYVFDPMEIADDTNGHAQLTDVVWKYHSEDEATKITRRFMDSLLDRMPCEEGVYDTLNWCLFEVLDNVFQHSQAQTGYVMMQLHKGTRKCAITVSDSGIGIHRAMAIGSAAGRIDREEIKTADRAIALAVRQGVTSKGKLNQGNGLFGLSKSVDINGGRLTIHSGKGTWSMDEGKVTKSDSDPKRPLLDLENNHGTTVDWQLNCENRVSIGAALGSRFQMGDLLESIETVDGYYELNAAELEESIGSRKHGREIRNRITNYLLAGAPQIVLNMNQLDTISSSFADEVLGRLAAELGEDEYRTRIAIFGASKTNHQIISRAVELRIEAEKAN